MAYLDKNTLCIGTGDAVHGIEGEPEVGLVQQRLKAVKVKDGAQQLQIILHGIYHL